MLCPSPPWPVSSSVKWDSNAPSALARPQEACPHYFSWDCPEHVVQDSSKTCPLTSPPSPGLCLQGSGRPSTALTTPTEWRTKKEGSCGLPAQSPPSCLLGQATTPARPPELLVTMPGARDPAHGSHPASQSPLTPGDPRPHQLPRCLPPPASPLTGLMPQKREGH